MAELIIYMKKEKRMKTTDDWYGNYDNDEVVVSLDQHYYEDVENGIMPSYISYILIRGNDDFGLRLEKTAETKKESDIQFKELESMYNYLPEIITKDWAFKNGFDYD